MTQTKHSTRSANRAARWHSGPDFSGKPKTMSMGKDLSGSATNSKGKIHMTKMESPHAKSQSRNDG